MSDRLKTARHGNSTPGYLHGLILKKALDKKPQFVPNSAKDAWYSASGGAQSEIEQRIDEKASGIQDSE